MDPVDVFADAFETTFDDAGLDEDGAEEDDRGLDQEGEGEGAAAGGLEVVGDAGEEDGAQEEADEGGEGLCPAVRSGCGVVVGSTEAEEHGVA